MSQFLGNLSQFRPEIMGFNCFFVWPKLFLIEM